MWAIIGIILIAVAVAIGFFLEKQAFERRNAAGVEQFKDYKTMVKIRAEEGLCKAIGAMIALGGIISITAWFMS